MKSLISAAFGAAALATSAFAVATPAQARSDVGVYVGPGGLGVSVDYYRSCRDYWYRRNHPYQCGYGRYDERYYRNYSYDYDYDYRHHRHHHRDWDRDRDRRHHDRDRDRHHDRDRDRDHRW